MLALTRRTLREIAPYATAVLCGFAAVVGLMLVVLANPFTAANPVPAEGVGLNPLLRHPSMMIHPPMLYSGYTLWAIPFAFAIGALIGVPLGVLLGSNEKAYRSVEFLIDFFRSTPSSALIPLFILIFGVSDINKVAIAAFGAFLIVVFNSAYGVINARKQRVMAAKVMGASRWRQFKDVLVWESLQPTFVGLRSAVSMALVIVIVAEMFIGSDSGLGHRIINSQQVMNVRDMYASILSAGALGYALNVLFLLIERRIVHWSGR